MKLSCAIATAAILFVTSQAMAQTDKPAPPDWITATNQPCKVWNPAPQPNESVMWSGPCKDGYASGKGVLLWTANGKPDAEFDGECANGKRNGHGVLITSDGERIEGEWLNDNLLTGDSNAI
jgi:MORN repeat protein